MRHLEPEQRRQDEENRPREHLAGVEQPGPNLAPATSSPANPSAFPEIGKEPVMAHTDYELTEYARNALRDPTKLVSWYFMHAGCEELLDPQHAQLHRRVGRLPDPDRHWARAAVHGDGPPDARAALGVTHGRCARILLLRAHVRADVGHRGRLRDPPEPPREHAPQQFVALFPAGVQIAYAAIPVICTLPEPLQGEESTPS